jgi:hypothetical protein
MIPLSILKKKKFSFFKESNSSKFDIYIKKTNTVYDM